VKLDLDLRGLEYGTMAGFCDKDICFMKLIGLVCASKDKKVASVPSQTRMVCKWSEG
jgi:hypothetical protein